jgi:hypothetical protein
MHHLSDFKRKSRRTFLRLQVCFVTLLSVTSPALAEETTTYTYDALGRLTNSAHSGTVNPGLNQAYSHDAADNRTNVTVTGSPYSSTARFIVVPLNGLTLIPIAG